MPIELTRQEKIEAAKTEAEAIREEILRMQREDFPPKDPNLGEEPPVIRYGDEESEAEKYFEGLDTSAPTEEEQTTIREDIRARMQNQIDAIMQSYNKLIGRAEEAGVEAGARARSISARAGLLGSPRGEAIRTGVKEITKGQVEAYESERGIKVAGVLSKIDQAVEDKIEAETLKAEGNMEKYLIYQEKAQTDARNNMSGLAESGVSLARLKLATREDGEEGDIYKELLEDTGWNSLQFDAMYNNSLPEEEQIKYQYTWKGNNLVAIGVDPATGQLVTQTYSADDLNIPTGIDVGFITNENTGEMWWYDKEDPLDVDGNLKATSMGKMGITPSDIAKPATQFQMVSAGYADRMKSSNERLEELEDKVLGLNPAQFATYKALPNFAKPAWIQQLEQLERNFVNAVLRRESGAVINEEEFVNARQQYFPQPGDKPDVLADKKRNREMVTNNMIRDAGVAWEDVSGVGDKGEGGERIKVRIKTTGEIGTIPLDEFDEEIYEKVE